MRYAKAYCIQAPDNWSDSSQYPGDGLYIHSGQVWLVENGMTMSLSMCHTPQTFEDDAGSGNADVLKAIAVMQDPKLAFDDLRGKE